MADNLSILQTPELNESYQTNFQNLISSINSNFEILSNKINANNLLQNTKINNAALHGLLDVLRVKLGLPYNSTSSKNYQYNNLGDTDITYYKYPDGTLHIPATTIIDDYYYSQVDGQISSNLTNYTCIFTGIYNGREWNIGILNNFPKIVYNNGSFVWQIGDKITSINAQGLKGEKGDNTSVTALTTVFVTNPTLLQESNSITANITEYINNEGIKVPNVKNLTSGTPAICTAQVNGSDNIYSGYIVVSGGNVVFNGQKMILLQAITPDEIQSIWNTAMSNNS